MSCCLVRGNASESILGAGEADPGGSERLRRAVPDEQIEPAFHIMMSLLNEGAITFDDLEGFSDDLKDTTEAFCRLVLTTILHNSLL